MADDVHPFEPNWTVHPGSMLAELLDMNGMTPERLAEDAGIALETVGGILDGTASIDGQAAVKLGSVFATPQVWLNYQAGFDADIARGVTSVLYGRVNDSAATAAPREDEGP